MAPLLVMAGASGANAADLGTVTWNGTSVSRTNLSGVIGDTFTFQNTTAGGGLNDDGSLRNGTGMVSIGGTSCTVPGGIPSCPILAGQSRTVTITQVGQLTWVTGTTTTSISIGSGGSEASGTGGDSTPAPVLQQFAKPATGTCDAAEPAGANLAGVSSGGWGTSWAQWVNNGAGGAVCTRTLAYNTNTGAWAVE